MNAPTDMLTRSVLLVGVIMDEGSLSSSRNYKGQG